MSELKDFLNSGGTHAPQINENTERLDTQITNPNLLINGDFSVWQRGTTSVGHPSFTYAADRWITSINGTSLNLFRADAGGDPDAFFGSRYAIGCDTGVSVSSYGHVQRIESTACGQLRAGQLVSLSFRVWTSDGAPVEVGGRMWRSNNFDDWSAFWDMADGGTQTVNHGDVAKFTMVVPNEYYHWGTQIGIGVYDDPSVRIVAITDAKFELGAGATPFIADAPADNLAKCQRYFYRSTNTETLMVSCWSTPSVYGSVNAPIAMREPPIWLFEEASFFYDGGSFPVTPAVDVASTQNARFTFNHTATVTRTASGWLQTKFSADAEL
ncbi:hypothetical protein VPHD432_0022 [Vibrio phage D432]